MDLKKVEEILLPYLEEHNLSLYDIKWTKEYGYNVLQVLIDKDNGIDTDTLALCNEFLSIELDKIDSQETEYMLEVSSPGAEKPLRNKDEVLKSIGKYIHVKLQNEEFDGELIDFDNEILTIKINVKGRIKNISVNYDDIKKIRLAVRF